MLLPPNSVDGSRPTLPDSSRQLLIIGANGAGKSRFTAQLLDSLPSDKVFPLSPLSALFGAYNPDAPEASIDGLYHRAVTDSPIFGSNQPPTPPASQLERLIALLVHDEVINLLHFKVERPADGKLPATRLDRVLALWHEIFPENEVLHRGGTLLFSRSADGVNRSSARLSAGEKLVLYYFGAMLYAPQDAVIPVDNPDMFLHPSTLRRVWDRVESLRPDCTFVYTTHDLDFASTRSAATTVWVRGCSPDGTAYDYDILSPQSQLSDEMYMTILGARRPVMFIEGDDSRSIDSKLYPLIFPDYTVKALGSCDRVIESTRVFNSLNGFHHLDSVGIVDRDRRSAGEVDYLRKKKIMVPEVAEVENLFMLEEVVRTIASVHRRDENKAFSKVKAAVMSLFKAELKTQALQHTRHYVKRTVEHRIDGRFANITKLEEHMVDLIDEINPRAIYENFCREFNGYVKQGDYASVLRVFNHKPMLSQSNVSTLTGCNDVQAYITSVLNTLKTRGEASTRLRTALRAALR
jgi:hypothetical protein